MRISHIAFAVCITYFHFQYKLNCLFSIPVPFVSNAHAMMMMMTMMIPTTNCHHHCNYDFQSTIVQSQQHPMFVVISCGCCFLQSCIAFGVLLPILYSRKCSVTFLKMQFCTATSTAMAIFTLGFLKFLPQVSKYS